MYPTCQAVKAIKVDVALQGDQNGFNEIKVVKIFKWGFVADLVPKAIDNNPNLANLTLKWKSYFGEWVYLSFVWKSLVYRLGEKYNIWRF